MNNSKFKFSLGAMLAIAISGETGTVVARAEYLNGQDQYLIRYKTTDGRAVESWWADDALVDKTPEQAMKIILNGCEKILANSFPPLSYEALSCLAGIEPKYTPTIVWSTSKQQGMLVRGEVLKVEDGMVFNVGITGNA